MCFQANKIKVGVQSLKNIAGCGRLLKQFIIKLWREDLHKYLRSIGFSMYKKKTEIKTLLDKIQKKNIALAKITVTKEKERLWEIRKDLSKHIGICLYGYLENLGTFIREGFYPYIKDPISSSTSPCTVQKHFDDEQYFGMLDDIRLGISIIFKLANSFDFVDNDKIKKANTCLFGFCDDGKVLLPLKKTLSQIEISKMKLLNRNLLIEAAKEGDEEAIDILSTDELKTYSYINSHIPQEDIYSLVDTLFMPYGMEADMYNIIGNIIGIKEEKNFISEENLTILQLESNNIKLTVAMKKEDLQGEPVIGRRFKGNVWMLGYVNSDSIN